MLKAQYAPTYKRRENPTDDQSSQILKTVHMMSQIPEGRISSPGRRSRRFVSFSRPLTHPVLALAPCFVCYKEFAVTEFTLPLSPFCDNHRPLACNGCVEDWVREAIKDGRWAKIECICKYGTVFEPADLLAFLQPLGKIHTLQV